MSRKLSSVSGESPGNDGHNEDVEHSGINLPAAGLFGRSEELQALHKVKQQVVNSINDDGNDTDSNATSTLLLPAVLVWGVSGTGKSSLIQQFLQETKQQSACYILQGKYDEYTGSSDPFSALVQALNGFSVQLKKGSIEELERVRKCIKAEFGNNEGDAGSSALSALINVVPSLSILLGNGDNGSSGEDGSSGEAGSTDQPAPTESESAQYSLQPPASSNMGVNESVWNRLQYIFLQFVKAISTKERPIYLFFDDLQWSSHVALELLANLVSDPELKHFLFLGSARQETNLHTDEVLEVATTSPLNTSFLSRLQSQPNKLAQITTQNLSLDDTTQFLSSLLGDHPIDDGLNTLARKIHAKTRGNIFFTMQGLEELQRKNMLVYDQASLQWEWNFDTINGHDISISDNIIGVIESKLRQLPQDLQDVLSVAAYVGASFDVATLLHAVQNEHQCDESTFLTTTTETIDEQYVCNLLEKAVLEKVLHNPIGGSKYRFVHDRIQQAARGMVPKGEAQNLLRARIGHCLLKLYREIHQAILTSPSENALTPFKNKTGRRGGNTSSSKEDDHGLLFVATDHLNSVPTKDHMFSVILNLEVGERAIQMAALASAAAYLERAVEELKLVDNPWEDHYDISLRLHRVRCDVELSLGHFQLGYDLGDEVLNNTKTADEKLPTYLSMAHGLGREDKHLESLNMCLLATTQVNEFPKRCYLGHVASGMMKIRSFLRRNDNDAVLRLPFMTDERKLISMKLLTEIVARAFLTQSMVIVLVNVCQQLRNTIRFGLCEDSAVSFACYGLLSGASGDQAMAMRCAGLAQRIINKTKGKSVAGWVCIGTGTFITPFQSSIVDVIQEHHRGYKSSMETGDFELGFMNWQGCSMVAFLGGFELQPLVRATETTVQQSKMYRVESMANMTYEYLAMLHMLIGEKSIDWNQIEEAADRNIKKEKLDPSQHIALSSHFYCRMILATYFRRYDLGKKLADLYRQSSSEEKTCVSIISRGLYTGINAAGRYHETGKRKHLRMLKKMLVALEGIAKKRGPKFIHHVLMLKAELTSIQNRNSSSVKEAYGLAISVASSASFVQDAALTSELAGEYCIRQGCSKSETSAYFMQAAGFYEDWGCVVKVDDLKQRRSEYLSGLSGTKRVTHMRAEDDGIVSNMFGNKHSPAARVDVLSSFTPSTIPMMESSVADSGTKASFGLQGSNMAEEDNNDEDCNLSVLTDGSQ